MARISFRNSSDWSYRGGASRIARTVTINRRTKITPIPKFQLGFSLNARFLAVAILVEEAKPTWNAGGFLNQVHKIPFTTQASPKGKAITNSQFLLMNKTNLVDFPRLSGQSYNLIYAPPPWFPDVKIKVWQYRGEEFDFVEDTLASLENKINQLL